MCVEGNIFPLKKRQAHLECGAFEIDCSLTMPDGSFSFHEIKQSVYIAIKLFTLTCPVRHFNMISSETSV